MKPICVWAKTRARVIARLPQLAPLSTLSACSKTKVFKITLPCSGKVTDEVDVQVLINILGQVEEDSSLGVASSGNAEQHAPAPLEQAGRVSEAPETSSRLVSHTLAIKRKKICTIHPMPVHPRPPTQPVLPAATPTPIQSHEQNRWPSQPIQTTHSDYLEHPVSEWSRRTYCLMLTFKRCFRSLQLQLQTTTLESCNTKSALQRALEHD